MISILPPTKIMLSDDEVTQLEAQLQRAHVLKVERKAAVECKAVEEHCLAKEKVVVEAEE